MDKKIEKIINHYKNYDDEQGYEYIGELQFDNLIKSIKDLIQQAKEEYLQNRLKDYDVGSLEYKIISEWIKRSKECLK